MHPLGPPRGAQFSKPPFHGTLTPLTAPTPPSAHTPHMHRDASNVSARASERAARQAWSLAVVAAFLFALGAVATWAQEFVVWLPHRLASVLMLAGLALSVWSLTVSARRLFAPPPPARAELRALAGAIFFSALPPCVFLAWAVWLHVVLAACRT